VPGIPELSQVGLEIRRGEVLGQLHPQRQPQADGDVSIPGKVEVNLQRINVKQQPHPARAAHLRGILWAERHQRQRISDDEFFSQPQHQPPPGLCPLLAARVAARRDIEIALEALQAVDWPGQKRREKDHVAGESAQIRRGQPPGLTVAQGVDEAEADVREPQPAEIQRGGQFRLLPGQAAQSLGRQQRELRSLEHHQQRDEHHDRRGQGRFGRARPAQDPRQPIQQGSQQSYPRQHGGDHRRARGG